MEPFFIWTAIILALPFLSPDPKTSVILLENNSSHNAVDVSTKGGKVGIDQPYYFTTLESSDKVPSAVEKGDPEAILKRYADVLNALPSKAESILFYFEPGTAEITLTSKAQIDSLLQLIVSKEPAAIDIIGHSDRSGDADKNYELALQRAYTVEKFIREHNVPTERISIASYGENDPLIPTEDGISEPRNRRVEVIVR